MSSREWEPGEEKTVDEVWELGDDGASPEQLAQLNAYLDANRGMRRVFSKRLGYAIEAPAPFHAEARAAGWPRGVDGAVAYRFLWESYERARAMPHTNEIEILGDEWVPSEYDMILRLGGPLRLDWWATRPPPGTVAPSLATLMADPEQAAYYGTRVTDGVVHSFSDAPLVREQLHRGTTHVDFGFVDLRTLLHCDLLDDDHNKDKDKDEDKESASGGQGRPLTFVGYDRCPYAVAKAAVVWEMCRLENTEASVDDQARAVAQVWFSATWAPATVGLFKRAVDVAAAAHWSSSSSSSSSSSREGKSTKRPGDEVQRILDHWLDSPGVSLAAARAAWEPNLKRRLTGIGACLEEADRVRLAHYHVSGDFCVPKTLEPPPESQKAGPSVDLVGSVCRFDVPAGTAPFARHESAMETVGVLDMLRVAHAEGCDLVTSAETVQVRALERLIARARAGEVHVDLRLGEVPQAQDALADLKARTFAWNNIVDYFSSAADFHDVARAASRHAPATHSAFSMNWPTEVMGTHLVDFPNPENRKHLLHEAHDYLRRLFDVKLPHNDDDHHIDNDEATTPITPGDYFGLPVPEHPFSFSMHFLCNVHRDAWVRHWANQSPSCRAVHHGAPMYNPISPHGATNTALAWTYDPILPLPEPPGTALAVLEASSSSSSS